MVLLFEPQSTVAACANFCVLILVKRRKYTVRTYQKLCIGGYCIIEL